MSINGKRCESQSYNNYESQSYYWFVIHRNYFEVKIVHYVHIEETIIIILSVKNVKNKKIIKRV